MTKLMSWKAVVGIGTVWQNWLSAIGCRLSRQLHAVIHVPKRHPLSIEIPQNWL
jgi:hypothetical protein